jgi:ABC-type multidrug transport system fused ATPase/permease subunit
VRWFAILVLATAGSIAISSVSGILSTLIHERYAFGVRSGVFERMLFSRCAQVTSYHSGDVMTRLTSDIDAISGGIATLIPSCCYLMVMLTVSFFVLYHYDHILALAALVLGPFGVLMSLLFGDQLRRYQKELNDNESAFRGFTQESIANITVVKAFQQERHFSKRLSDIRAQRLDLIRKRNIMNTVIRMAVNVMFSAGYLLAFGWGLYRLSRGEITYGTMSVLLSLTMQVQGPIMSLSSVVPQFINVLASVGRVMEMDGLDLEPQIAPGALSGAVGVRLDAVSFSYDKECILRDVTIDILPGETVGLVGHSGSGKTTIARLLLSLIQPDRGQIVFYGRDGTQEPASAAARRLISYVPQGNTLLSGTIRSNLTMGSPDASDEALWRAVEIADAAQFVRDLPDGLDTSLSERAGTLSEGQAQRLAIARALLRASPVLILDEATSALDIEAERRIIKSLNTHAADITCLVITHRLSLLNLCGRCYQILDNQVHLKRDA